MAMLAEPKRRQKWSLNPRGTLWSDDQNKFGQKLMEKMGWNKGEGLGKDGQGITDHIKANYKDNNKGIGYKGKDDEWIKHYDAFENVLAALNSENNSATNSPVNSTSNSPASSPVNSPANSEDEDEETKSRKSLENRSKNSRARVHYHKFTRGKDLANYKEEDLACILGSKRSKRKDPSFNASVEGEVKEEVIEKEKKDFIGEEVGTTKNVNGVVTIAGGNYQEYFAKKMAALKQRQENANSVNNIQNKMNDKEELSPLKINEDTSLETKKSKKKKKKYKDNEHSVTCNENSDVDQQDNDHSVTCNDDSNIDQHDEICISKNEKEKKKKKSKKDVSNSNMLEENGIKEDGKPLFGFEFSCGFTNGSTIKKYPFNSHNTFASDDEAAITKDYIDVENSSPKSKKKKQKIDQGSLEETVESKEKKKKKSKDTNNQMEETTAISKNENAENTSEEVIKKTKKKKHKNKDEVEKSSTVFENENTVEFEKKEKVKKKNIIEEVISNDYLPENTEARKKKKKHKSKLENDSLIMKDDPTLKNSTNEEVNQNEKRKSKKRKREEEEIGSDDSSNSKKIKINKDDLSQKASPGKNELKRREYWKEKTKEISKKKKDRKQKSKNKYKISKCKNKDTMAKKVLQAFEGAKVPNIITKRDKKKMEHSRVP